MSTLLLAFLFCAFMKRYTIRIMSNEKPRVGLGVIIENDKGKILIMKREGKHAPYWSIPGGKLELGETFEEGAARELKEELDIDTEDLKIIAVTNNLQTYKAEGVHFISVILLVKTYEGQAKIMEPARCTEIKWVDPHDLPQPHFDASELGVQCYLQSVPYVSKLS
jgi:8-oxo-dGTP diphosphatase